MEQLDIGWIGLGVMGEPMARHLQAAGHRLHLYPRTASKADALLEAGATLYDSPAALAPHCSVLCCMVGHPSDLKQVMLGDDGATAHLPADSLLIDFTTSSPALAREIATLAAAKNIDSLDAPVSGGDIGAKNATLSIMVGGSETGFQRAASLLDLVGKTVVHQGGPGAGQDTKAVNQITVAGTMIGICESLIYARKAGLDPETVLKSVGGGAATSWSLVNLWPRILQDDFQPGFFIEHFVKDMGIAIEECDRMGLKLPGLLLARNLYQALIDQGKGRLGTQALIQALDQAG